MATYPAPTENLVEFNPLVFDTNNVPLTIAEGEKYFLKYPVAQGAETFSTTTTGTANITTGVVTGTLNTSNSTDIATVFGYQTSIPTGTSIHNTAYGYQAAKTLSATTGTGGNTAFGAITMPAVTGAGSNNTAIGHNALSSLTSGSRNTCVGAVTVTTTITTGTDNTTLGFDTKVGAGFSNSTAIGSGALAGASNQIVLGTATETIKYQKVSPLYTTTLPTYASTDIGYSLDTTITYPALTTNSLITQTLGAGVWICEVFLDIIGGANLLGVLVAGTQRSVIAGVPQGVAVILAGSNVVYSTSMVLSVTTSSAITIVSKTTPLAGTVGGNANDHITFTRIA